MEHKKHILFISSWYPNRNNPTHGIFNEYMADAASLYSTISVLHVCSEAGLEKDFDTDVANEGGITVVTVYYKKISSSIPGISPLLKYRKMIRAYDTGYDLLVKKTGAPELIQLNVVMPAGLGAYHLSEKHGIPYVINENWSGYCEEDGAYKGALLEFFTRRIVGKARKIMPTSDYLKSAMLRHGLRGDYAVVPNVVNVNLFQPGDKVLDPTLTRFIHISSLNNSEKNITGILRAFAAALAADQDMELTIVGEGEGKHELMQLASDLGLNEKVVFRGRVMSKDLVNEINSHNALVMFSNYETFCLVIIEAFACGKPVITSNAGAIESYMTPGLGIMVEKGKEDQLTEAFLRFAREKENYDPAYIREVAVEEYSYEKVGERLTQIYNEALA